MSSIVPQEIERSLEDEPLIAHLATCLDGRPHVAPVWFHYEGNTLSVLTGGQKLANIRRSPRVAISIQEDAGGRTEWMVSLRGTARVVEDEDETNAAVSRINTKYGAPESAYPQNVLVRVEIASVSWRRYC